MVNGNYYYFLSARILDLVLKFFSPTKESHNCVNVMFYKVINLTFRQLYLR